MTKPWNLGNLCKLTEAEMSSVTTDLDVRVIAPSTDDADAVTEVVRAAELLICGIGPLLPTTHDIEAAPRLAFVQKLGSGVDNYDLAAFDRAGVPLANMPGSTGPAIAEWCLGAALALTRRLVTVDAAIRAGDWPHQKMRPMGVRELSSLRVGIIGMGAIGQGCAALFRAMGCAVGYSNRSRRPSLERSLGIRYLPLDALCRESDVVIVALSLNNQTDGLLGRDLLASLPFGAYVINAARGRIVDEQALIHLLSVGHLGGAALDVFVTEPLPTDSPLRALDNVLLFPHSAADSPQTRQRLFRLTNDNLRRAIDQQDVRWVVNAASPAVRRRPAAPDRIDHSPAQEPAR